MSRAAERAPTESEPRGAGAVVQESGQGPGTGSFAGALCAVAFASGCAALLFETLWFRAAGLAFGNGVWASSLVLAAFMAGLATGNFAAARFADRLARPLRAYAGLEVAIGVSGLALVLALPALTGVLAPLFQPLRDAPWLLNAVRLALAFGLLMIPATAMGATLPVLVKALFARDPRFGRVLGRVYGWNTLGAVAGSLLGEALLIERIGLRGSGLAAAGINFAAACGCLALARGASALPAPGRGGGREAAPARLSGESTRLLLAAFGAGAVFLALEVVWFRFLSLFVYGTSLVFAVMLAVVLVGISLGGLAGGRWLSDSPRARRLLPSLALLAGCGVLASYAAFEGVFRAALSPGHAAAAIPHVALLAVPLMLPVAFLSGVLFPAIGDALQAELGAEARTTGWLTLANTLGAAVGSLLAGFVLLPVFGIEASLAGLGLAYAALALAMWPRSGAGAALRPALALGAALAGLALLFPRGALREVYLPHPTTPFLEEGSEIVAVREGRIETIVFLRTSRFGRPLHHRMFTDGFSMSATTTHSKRYMKAYVYLPVALHPAPRSALLISFGVGSTAKALTDTRELESIEVVDISPDILDMSEVVFPAPGESPLDDPRVRVHVEDGRFFLQTVERRFDLITAEPPPPKYAGVVNLYTREYFALLRERLAEGGLTTYWLPVHDLGESDARAIVAAFCGVFPDCTLWSGAGLDWMLVGTRPGGPEAPVSAAHFARQWRDPVVGPELRALGFESPGQLGATFLADAADLAEWVGETPPLVDDFPLRLSNRPVSLAESEGARSFSSLMEARGAEERMRASDFVRRRFPPEVRAASAEAFRWQPLWNARLQYEAAAPVTERDLHEVLAESDLRTLPLWILGSDATERRLAESQPARADPEVARVRGLAALVDRDYAGAARWLAQARRGVAGREGARLATLQIYALCMAGEPARAARLARNLVRASPAAARSDAYWRFLEDTFGLPDPRRPARASARGVQ